MVARRRKIRIDLAFITEGRGEALKDVDKGTEASMAKRESEGPVSTVFTFLMEQLIA